MYTYIDSGREHSGSAFGETLESTKRYGKFRQLCSTAATQLELRDYFATNAETLGNSWGLDRLAVLPRATLGHCY